MRWAKVQINMQLEVNQLFSYPVVVINLDDFFVSFFEKERKNQIWRENIHEHCFNNYVSKDMNILEKYPKEKQKLLDCVNFYKNEIMKWTDVELSITTSWMTKTKQNGFSKPHSHKNSLVSGVVYDSSTSEKNAGPLYFQSTKTYSSILPCNPSTFNYENCTEAYIDVLPNRLILFESCLKHHIGKHLSPVTRYSLAFNTFPKGSFGFADSSLIV